MAGLNWITQDDFAAGTMRAIGRDQDQGVGVWNAVNGLFDDDGDCYLRGNTRAYSANAAEPLTFLWTGTLNEPTLLASSKLSLYTITGAKNLLPLPGTPVTRPVKCAVVAGKLFLPNGVLWAGPGNNPVNGQLPAPLPGAVGEVHLCAAADRLIIGQGRFIRFSKAGDPLTFDPTDYHELPGGSVVKGIAAIRDTVLVFTGYGIWAIHNLALDLTDDLGNPQQIMSKIIPELSLLHEAGLAEWNGRIIAPCRDRCYLVDTMGTPTSISDSIGPLYMQHITAARLPGGGKAFRNHYFLPWLNQDGTVASVLACRVSRPVKGRFTYYPWSVLTGHAAQMVYGDSCELDDVPQLLSGHADGKLITLLSIFDPSRDVALDADGTTPEFDLETRELITGNGQPNHVRVLRLYYTLDPLEGSEPSIQAALSTGVVGQSYETLRAVGSYQDVEDRYASYSQARQGDTAISVPAGSWSSEPDRHWAALEEQAAPTPGLDPMRWTLQRPSRVRYIKARFRCTDPVAKLVVHRIDVGVRPATHTR